MASKLEAKSFSLSGFTVVVKFADDHQVLLSTCWGGFDGPSDAQFEAFELRRGGNCVALFHSPHQRPRNRRGDGFQPVNGGYGQSYPLQKLLAYWQAARDYLATFTKPGKSANGEQWTAWSIVCQGRFDFDEIKEGKWPLP